MEKTTGLSYAIFPTHSLMFSDKCRVRPGTPNQFRVLFIMLFSA